MLRRDLLRLLTGCSAAAATGTNGLFSIDPALAQTAAAPDVEIELTAAPDAVQVLPGAPTAMWRYRARLLRGPAGTLETLEGSHLGPVLRLRPGQRVRVRFKNELPEPSVVHWHGLDVPELADGHPRLAVDSGAEYVYDFQVTNRAGMSWYHPHPHMRTAAQAYLGLAGPIVISDPEEESLGLPSGPGELLLTLQDRRFDAANQLVYFGGSATTPPALGRGRGMGRGGMSPMMEMMGMMNGWLGDRVLVSGRLQPTLDVDRRTYRVRLLNGSNARIYRLAWSTQEPFVVIGNDGGLFDRPHAMSSLTLAPGQRADVILDLSQQSAGATVQLRSLAFPADAAGHTGMMRDNSPVPQGAPLVLATLRVSSREGARYVVPERLTPDSFTPVPSAPVRRVPLTFMQMNWFIDGRTFDMEDVAPSETVDPGSTHIWEIVNQPNPMAMGMAHPIHLHGRHFRVVSRTGGGPNALRSGLHDQGWTDTVLILPGETVRIQVTFSNYPGLYLYHCHILEHEDMGMMRNFRIAG